MLSIITNTENQKELKVSHLATVNEFFRDVSDDVNVIWGVCNCGDGIITGKNIMVTMILSGKEISA